MRRLVLFVLSYILFVNSAITATEEFVHFGRFGTVTLYYESPCPSHVVLFVSGDGGWNLGVMDMARALAAHDALVVGIDIVHFLKAIETSNEPCSYPAGDFEELSKFVQKKLNFTNYVAPVLIGYSSGATLVYAALVQAPPNTFRGAISLGFCPDLPLAKPFCRGNSLAWQEKSDGKGISFLPANNLEAPWIALQGAADQVCHPPATEAFVRKMKTGEVVLLPNVGHGFAVQKNWLPQFERAFSHLVENKENEPSPPSAEELKDLPLIEVPAAESVSKLLAVHITGDGGWGVTDRGLSKLLAAQGIPVIGLNSLKYFWTQQSPEGSSRDLQRVLLHYLAAWKKEQAVLIGYSFGADVLPFLISRLPEELRTKVRLIVLLSPSQNAEFEFHFTNWLDDASDHSTLPVLPEVEKLKGMKLLCFCGDKEKDSLCKIIDPSVATVISRQGGHRLGGNYAAIAQTILNELK